MEDISKSRFQTVVKANSLIQKSRYSLSLQEQRLVQYMISKITPDTTRFEEVCIDIKDVCLLLNIDPDSGGNYEYIKRTLKRIRDRSVWIELPDRTEMTFSWFSTVILKKHSGRAILCFDKASAPFLLQLKSHFTQYNLFYTLAMKSVYSIRLYELLKSYQNLGEAEFSVDDLRNRLDATNKAYNSFGRFREKVLNVALDEIERLSDLKVEMETIRSGRFITRIKFKMSEIRFDYENFIGRKKTILENIGAKNAPDLDNQPMVNQIGLEELVSD